MPDFRSIPSIELLRQRPAVRMLEARFGPRATVDALRAAAEDARSAIAGGDTAWSSEATVVARREAAAELRFDDMFRPSLKAVINATGIILHTNLGRAPLTAFAI